MKKAPAPAPKKAPASLASLAADRDTACRCIIDLATVSQMQSEVMADQAAEIDQLRADVSELWRVLIVVGIVAAVAFTLVGDSECSYG